MTVWGVFGVVLGAWYLLFLVQRVFFGPLKEGDLGHADPPVRDISFREVAALAPLVVFIFWIGLHPEFFLDRMRPTLEPLASRAAQALDDRYGSNAEALVDKSQLPLGSQSSL